MTVAELIKNLQGLNQNALIVVMTCVNGETIAVGESLEIQQLPENEITGETNPGLKSMCEEAVGETSGIPLAILIARD